MKNVAKKILLVMQNVGYLQKDGNVDYKNQRNNSRTNYGFLSEEKVTGAISRARAEIGLLILPIKVESKRDGNLSMVNVTYAIIDPDSGESIHVQMEGCGADSQDKGIAKAMTQAFKYIQRQTFGISTGDDPDHISSDEITDKMDQEKAKQQKQMNDINKQVETNYKKLKWDMKKFDSFIGKLADQGYSISQINDFLLLKIAESKQTNETQRGQNIS